MGTFTLFTSSKKNVSINSNLSDNGLLSSDGRFITIGILLKNVPNNMEFMSSVVAPIIRTLAFL